MDRGDMDRDYIVNMMEILEHAAYDIYDDTTLDVEDYMRLKLEIIAGEHDEYNVVSPYIVDLTQEDVVAELQRRREPSSVLEELRRFYDGELAMAEQREMTRLAEQREMARRMEEAREEARRRQLRESPAERERALRNLEYAIDNRDSIDPSVFLPSEEEERQRRIEELMAQLLKD